MQHLRVRVQRGVDESDRALPDRNALLVDPVQDRGKYGGGRTGPADQLRLAIDDDDDVVSDGREVRVAASAFVVDTAGSDG